MFQIKSPLFSLAIILYTLNIISIASSQYVRPTWRPLYPYDYNAYYPQHFPQIHQPFNPKRQQIFNSIRPVDFMRRPGQAYFGAAIPDYKPKLNHNFTNVARRSNRDNANLANQPCSHNCSWVPPLAYLDITEFNKVTTTSTSSGISKRNEITREVIQNKIRTSQVDHSQVCKRPIKKSVEAVQNFEWMDQFDFPLDCPSKSRVFKCFCDVF